MTNKSFLIGCLATMSLVAAVGYYLSGAAALTILGLVAIPETRDEDLDRPEQARRNP